MRVLLLVEEQVDRGTLRNGRATNTVEKYGRLAGRADFRG